MRRKLKTQKLWLSIAILALPSFACELFPTLFTSQSTSSSTTATAVAETKPVAFAVTNTIALGITPTTTPSPRITQSASSSQPTATISTSASSTRAPNSPTVTPSLRPISTATPTTPVQSSCPALSLPSAKPSGLVKSATTAQDYDRNADAVIGPTTEFKSNSIVHAVVAVQNAPANTIVKSKWYANDIGKAAPCNTLIDEPELTLDTGGSGNLDFKQEPLKTGWPIGTYRVEVYVNGALDRILSFTVK